MGKCYQNVHKAIRDWNNTLSVHEVTLTENKLNTIPSILWVILNRRFDHWTRSRQFWFQELFTEIFGLRVALARLENNLTMSLQMQDDQLKALNGLSNGLAASITSLTDLHTQILNILQSCARKRGGNFSWYWTC